MNRREFLKNLAAAGIPIVLSGKLMASEHPFSASEEETLEVWKQILDYARWAPSAHNIQPWKIKLESAEEAKIYLDTSKCLPVADPNRAFIYISMSIFTECIKIAAENFGYSCELQYHEPAAEGLQLFAIAKLKKEEIHPAFEKELLNLRKTSRVPYNGKNIPEDVLTQLQTTCKERSIEFNHTNDEAIVKKILALNKETLFTDIDDYAYRIELQKWIRTNDEDAHQTKDGLWNYCMGVSGHMMHNFFYKHVKFKKKWKRNILGDHYLKSMKDTKDIIWFSGAFENFNDWVNCGSLLLSFWLTLTKNQCVMHPFGSLITHASTHAQLPKLLGHRGDKDIWFIARIGQSHEAPRSLRKDLETILIK